MRAQKCEKFGIARKRRRQIAMLRAGRHSSPDPSCRPARIIVGVLGDFGDEGVWGADGRGDGAVAEESDSHRLIFSSQSADLNHHSGSKWPTSASAASVARPRRLSARLPRIPPPLGAAACAPPSRQTPGADNRRCEKRKSAASRPGAWSRRRSSARCALLAHRFLFLTSDFFGKISL